MNKNKQSDLLDKIAFAVESRSTKVRFTKSMDLADKRESGQVGGYDNHGVPYREDPINPVNYTKAMDRAAA
jgi:hypothetical protein